MSLLDSEFSQTILMANRILEASADAPYGDMAVLAGQFLKLMKIANRFHDEMEIWHHWWRRDAVPVPLYLTMAELDYALPLISGAVAEDIRRHLPADAAARGSGGQPNG